MKDLDVQVGKTYNYFDDGKIKDSRMIPVTITEIVPFDQIDFNTLSFWKEEVTDCPWLYAPETDYFVIGTLDNINKDVVVFVRTVEGKDGWFSLGWWAGRLDVDGSLFNLMN